MKRIVLIAAFGLAALTRAADLFDTGYVGSAGGTALTGQQGWYNPAPGTPDFGVFTYAGNALGIAANPIGAAQFIAGVSQGLTLTPRAQHNFDFSLATDYTVSYYVNASFSGVPPATNNICKFSLQPATTGSVRTFNATAEWPSGLPATSWHYGYEVYDSTGVLQSGNQYPNTPWRFLATNRWYRVSTGFSLVDNLVVFTTITDMTTGASYQERPSNWYLSGGAAPVIPRPSACRFFVGGPTAGNTTAIDSFDIASGLVMVADAFEVSPGGVISGGLIQMFESDDSRLVLRPGAVFSTAQPPVGLTLHAKSPKTTVTSLRLQLEASGSVNLTQTVTLFNFQTGLYEQVDQRVVNSTDTTVDVTITAIPSRFVEPLGTREVRAKVTYKALGAVFAWPWTARVDMAKFSFLI